MPYYRRRSRWPYRSWRRRYSVQRSQQQGTRRFKVTIPVDHMSSIPVGTDGASRYFSIVPFCKILTAPAGDDLNYVCWGNLMGNPLFRTYCTLYDEVRICGVRLCVSVMGYPSGITTGGVKIVSCCDRRGNRDDIVNTPTTENLLNSADSLATEYTSLDRAKQFRSIWARDMMEKCAFYDATVSSWTVNAGAHSPYQYECNTAWRNLGSGGFSPMIMYRIVFANGPSAVQTCAVSVKASWTLEFRNPKWNTLNPVAAKFGEMREEAIADALVEGEDDVDREVPIDSVSEKKVKFEEPVYEESVVPDDDPGMDDESSQPELTKEEILELLRKYEEKKS